MIKLKNIIIFLIILHASVGSQNVFADDCPSISPVVRIRSQAALLFQKILFPNAFRLSEQEINLITEKFNAKFCLEPHFLRTTLQSVAVAGVTEGQLHNLGIEAAYHPFARTVLFQKSDLKNKMPLLDLSHAVFVGRFIHELWHAYYDLRLQEDRKTEIESIWIKHYSSVNPKISDRQALEFGDEAVGNYLMKLMQNYVECLRDYRTSGSLGSTACKVYGIEYFGDSANFDNKGNPFRASYRLHGYGLNSRHSDSQKAHAFNFFLPASPQSPFQTVPQAKNRTLSASPLLFRMV
jgi:hypothetical protein